MFQPDEWKRLIAHLKVAEMQYADILREKPHLSPATRIDLTIAASDALCLASKVEEHFAQRSAKQYADQIISNLVPGK